MMGSYPDNIVRCPSSCLVFIVQLQRSLLLSGSQLDAVNKVDRQQDERCEHRCQRVPDH